ncbi:EAL domain-containing protein [Cytobacillus massiliigabonensis]|uniref:EAL domain-containing protein n=1 Tax=Cytobacillus massiliigabonensis TaxID=1871011 RepID=UPI0015E0881D|nr:EAL domain-containing protein [Cytobacillus massiliigabonensis]
MKIPLSLSLLLLSVLLISYLKYRYTIEIKARRKAEEIIEYMTTHDTLTGLSNRYHFHNCLESELSNKSINSLAVIFIDLDRFKTINDTMGHGIGDRLLQEVSKRLMKCISAEGKLARIGGDEFLIYIPNLDRMKFPNYAESILGYFSKPFEINEHEIYTTLNIGISFYPSDGKDGETLIKKADSAMYQAKREGNKYQLYHSMQVEQMAEKLDVEMNLRKALEHEELFLCYQPKVNLSSGKITGAEALIRWNHPEKGLISPAEFIPLAEETGLIIPIGEWVIRTACMQSMSWQDAGMPPLVMSVNLSVRQLYEPNIVEVIKGILEETKLQPEYLEIEITESMLMDTEQGLKFLKELKGLGVQISLDDFGTGYSSLHYLKEFPINKLKIDQSFVRNCTFDSNDETIVKAIIAMAHQLKLEVIAEGVELIEHLIFLQRILCNEAQGYLFSKPLSAEEFVHKYENIEQIVINYGIPQELSNQKWMEEAVEVDRRELIDMVRHQQGMIFKFIKEDEKFIHTLCAGELTYQMGLLPEKIIGREPIDFLPISNALEKTKFYQRAWDGEENVLYQGKLNGVHYIASLRPIRKGGKVIEVIGTCIEITKINRNDKILN